MRFLPRHPAGANSRVMPLIAPAALLAALAVCAPAVAAIHIEISGVDGELRRNVEALLSLELYKDRDRIEPDAVERLYRRVPVEVRDALKPFGYYEPQVSSTLKPDEHQRNWQVQIAIDPGTPVLLAAVSVVIHGAGAADAVFARLAAAPALRQGERLRHAAYEKLRADLQAAADTYGYLDARMLRHELQVDPAAHQARVLLELDTGERYVFGPTTIDQHAVRDAQIRRYLRYREGEPYDAGKLLRTQFALDDSQFFSTVEVTQGPRAAATHIVAINIRATTARNGYSLGAGYGTDTGPRGTLTWLDPRVNDSGHRLRVQLQLSHITQTLNARYDIPVGDPVREKLSVQLLDQTQDVVGSLVTQQIALQPSITQSFGGWQRVLSASFAHNITTDSVDGRLVDNLVVPGITFAAVPEGYLGEDLFSRKLYAELIGSHHVLGANANFLRLDLQSERVLNLSERWHLLLRGELGASAVGNFQNLPAAYRFFAGGDRSVRGFAFDALSPLDTRVLATFAKGQRGVPLDTTQFVAAAERLGGRHLLTGTVEFERDLPHSLGVAAFSDFGNAFNRLGDPLALSVGVGVRLRLPVLTVGIDIAKALHAPGFADLPGPRLHINISPKL